MLSFWEKEHFLQYDIIIIGGGIVGLSTAISLKELAPLKSILILERGIFPTGASTKNAGFACIGSLTEILDDLQNMSEEEVLSLVTLRRDGLRRLRNRLGDDHIGYAENGSYELISDAEISALDDMDRINSLLSPLLNQNAFTLADDLISKSGFNKAFTRHLVRNIAEGELNTGLMMKRLLNLALTLGIEIKTGCNVSHFTEEADVVKVWIGNNFTAGKIAFSAAKLAICTNAFTVNLITDINLSPGRGQVLITKPIHQLKFKGIYHFNKGYYYFRRIGDRVLFGGGRNMDIQGETTQEFGPNELIREDLLNKLQQIILPDINVEIDDWWTGIMAFGPDKTPIVKSYSQRIFIGVRLGGMGVAIGSEIGEQLAMMINQY